MKRLFYPVRTFDRERFSKILEEAKGARTQTQFARDCNLSLSYICKYLNASFPTPPTEKTLRKIANVCKYSDKVYFSLMEAAGYETADDDTIVVMDFEKACYASVARGLFNQRRFLWKPLQSNTDFVDPTGELAIKLDNYPIEFWFFGSFFWRGSYNSEISPKWLLNQIPDRFFTEPLEPVKYSFVLDNKEGFSLLANTPLKSIAEFISVILIDRQKGEVIKEEYLDTALPVTDDLKKLILS